MLYRVIAMHKQGSFSKLQWLALRNLWGKRGQDLAEVPPETVIAISGVAKVMIQSELETTEIADLYYKVGLPCIPSLSVRRTNIFGDCQEYYEPFAPLLCGSRKSN